MTTAYDDRPDASDFPPPIPAHTCWRNGGVECRRCELEEQAEEAGGTLTCASRHHRREVHAVPGTDRCDDCCSEAQAESEWLSPGWTDPRHDGQGIWRHTPPHPPTVTDLLVAFVVCLLALTLFVGLVVAGRAAMCASHDNALTYCPRLQVGAAAVSFDIPCGEGRPDGSTCGTVPTRLYPRGNRCPACAPVWQPEAERRRALAQIAATS